MSIVNATFLEKDLQQILSEEELTQRNGQNTVTYCSTQLVFKISLLCQSIAFGPNMFAKTFKSVSQSVNMVTGNECNEQGNPISCHFLKESSPHRTSNKKLKLESSHGPDWTLEPQVDDHCRRAWTKEKKRVVGKSVI